MEKKIPIAEKISNDVRQVVTNALAGYYDILPEDIDLIVDGVGKIFADFVSSNPEIATAYLESEGYDVEKMVTEIINDLNKTTR